VNAVELDIQVPFIEDLRLVLVSNLHDKSLFNYCYYTNHRALNYNIRTMHELEFPALYDGPDDHNEDLYF
jgi:hypothetical protein